MEKQITDYLVNNYHPEVVILFGSRARGDAHDLSDWDFLLIKESSEVVTEKELFGEMLDVDVVGIPCNAEILVKKYDNALCNIKVTYRKSEVLLDLESALNLIYSKPKVLESTEVENRKYFIRRKLRKLEASVNDSGVFFFELGVFYEKAIQYWFELKNSTWKMTPKQAIPFILKHDPVYSIFLKSLYSNISDEEKLAAAREITKLITE